MLQLQHLARGEVVQIQRDAFANNVRRGASFEEMLWFSCNVETRFAR